MKDSLLWTLVATIPLVIGGAIRNNIDAPNSRPLQSAPTAAEHAEAVEVSKITACCLNITNVLPGKVYGGDYNSSGYSAQPGSYYSAQGREVKPACFVLPQSSQDVSIVIRTLTGRSDDETCRFAIRSGGHSPLARSSNINGGITLDLSFMKQVDVSPDRLSVNIGPGNRWQDVYSKLGNQSLGTSGGRVAPVGVGGLVTGGGISFFSRERGLVCDNVIEFEIVLSDASIVIANKEKNPDLFRALKGGSGNFGVVTRIKMKAFELENMWGGIIFHKKDDTTRRTIFKLFEEFTANTKDVNAHWIHAWNYVNAVFIVDWQATSNIHYTKPNANPPIFERLRARDLDGSSDIIPQLKTDLKLDTLTGLTQQLASLNLEGARTIFKSLTFKNSAVFMEEVYQLANAVVPNIKMVTGLRWSVTFQSLPKIIYSKALKTGGNALGLEDGEDDLIILLLSSTWDLSTDDAKMYDTAKTLFGRVQKRAQEMGVDHDFIYLNYADRGQDPIKGYGEASVEMLNDVAAQYDPKGLWQSKQVPGGFKLPKSEGMEKKRKKKSKRVVDTVAGLSKAKKVNNVAVPGDVADGPDDLELGALELGALDKPTGPPVDLPAVDVPTVEVEVEDVPAVVVPVEDVPVTPGHGIKNPT